METTKIKLSELHKTEKNVRKHSEKQLQEYVRSLEMFGQTRPFVVTEDGEILVGNGMYDAMIRMGATEGDAYIMRGLTRAQKTKLMLADNKVYELGATDLSQFDEFIKEIGDFDVPGFDEDLLKMIADSAKQAQDALVGYGRQEPVPQVEERRDVSEFGQTAASLGGATPYQPQSVQKTAGAVQVESGEQHAYVICPKCGEKIWL